MRAVWVNKNAGIVIAIECISCDMVPAVNNERALTGDAR